MNLEWPLAFIKRQANKRSPSFSHTSLQILGISSLYVYGSCKNATIVTEEGLTATSNFTTSAILTDLNLSSTLSEVPIFYFGNNLLWQ